METSPTAIMTPLTSIGTSASALRTVLSISPIEEDHDCLEEILGEFRWILHRALTLPSAIAFLAENRAPVVICERDLAPGTWRNMLDGTIALFPPPCVIVTSRLADEGLWEETLQAGAYDVLAKPFERDEVLRIVSLAARSWHDRHLRARVPKTPRPRAARLGHGNFVTRFSARAQV
jgi:DNA-binding NtrC family response regulator